MIEKKAIVEAALAAGFIRARILALSDEFPPESAVGAAIPANYAKPGRLLDAPALLVAALPYGRSEESSCRPPELSIAPFARRNYYREAVRRLQALARDFRDRYGREEPAYGLKRHYRVFCNSPVPEKPLAAACGLGVIGRNSLIITPEAGSLVIIAALTLPFPLEGDGPLTAESGISCENCGRPCMAACPTGALDAAAGSINREKCIQWYASGNGEAAPPEVAAKWGGRLYGCTACQDACVYNRRPIPGVPSSEGPLPPALNGEELLKLSDEGLRARFKGTALGLSWLTPAAIRRNIRIALGLSRCQTPFADEQGVGSRE
jgi:epoxyqueuosine reductase